MEKKAYIQPNSKVLMPSPELLQIGFVEGSIDGENVLGKENIFDGEEEAQPLFELKTRSVWDE